MDSPRYFVLAITLASMSISGPVTRFVYAPALAIVFWRVILAWPCLAAVALVRREVWPIKQAAGAGFFLALHWIGWVVAIQTTSIASAAIIMGTSVLWGSILSHPLLREPIPRRQWAGVILALGGVSLVLLAKQSASHSLSGDLCSFGGAWAWVAYSFIGRRARQHSGFWGYTATVYLSAALVILSGIMFWHQPLSGFSDISWRAIVVLAIFPTLLGHGGFNYLLRFMGPARLGLWTLSEPMMATLLAWPLFDEVPSVQVLIGGLAALLGVGLGVGERGNSSPSATSPL
jgi:drug/metabolite transporter (DMT)-like permease